MYSNPLARHDATSRRWHGPAILRIARLALAAVLAVGTVTSVWAADEGTQPAASATAPAYSKKGADTCLGCHEDPAVVGIFKNPHGSPNDARAPFGHGQLQCEACHGPGDAHARGKGKNRPAVIRFGRGSGTPVAAQNAQCQTCHNATTNHWSAGPHAQNDVGCADCHDSHKAKDPVLMPAAQTDVCGTCHQAQKSAQHMPYRHPLVEGKMACTSCHQPHGTGTPAQLKRVSTVETCTSCHTDLRGPFLWEHQPVSEDCSTCHNPHGSTNQSMLKARGPFLCQQCHQASGHPSTAYGSNNLPGRGTPSVYVVNGNCMNCHSQVHGSNHPSGAKLMR
jgi:DmsE family decaheme c-type cytochrome